MKKEYKKIPKTRNAKMPPREPMIIDKAEVLDNAGVVVHVAYEGSRESHSVELQRRSTYHPSFADRMLEVSKLGLTMVQIATAFGVGSATLAMWLKDHEEMRIAHEKGKWIHDHAVQTTLLKRATGYDYIETKTVEGVDAFGRTYSYTTTTTRHVPGDVTAEIFWLKNRHRSEWADVQHSYVNNTVDINVNKTLNLDTLTQEERNMVKSIALKQIASGNGIGSGIGSG